MINRVIILGNHIQALGMARQVHASGKVVWLFSSSMLSITRFSNTVQKFIYFKCNEDLLKKILDSFSGEKDTLLIPTNDEMVALLAKHYKLLDENFFLGIPSSNTVELFYNKRNTYTFAEENGISIPLSWLPNSAKDVEDISNIISYPVIIKPAVMHTFHKKLKKKAILCSNKNELINQFNKLTFFSPEELIVQEFLSGGAKTLYSYGVYAFNGQPIVSVMVNRIRQNPMTFGNSTTFAISCNEPRIKEIAERILTLTNYSGMAEIEFMYDSKTNEYKFLEVNTRPWKWHSISNALGFSFVNTLVETLNGVDVTNYSDYDKQVAWVERLTDFAVIGKEVFKNRMSVSAVLRSYRLPKENAVWLISDPLPLVMYFLFAPIQYFTRH